MGGGQSLNLAFARPELFRYVVLMSPAVDAAASRSVLRRRAEESGAVNKQFKLFWVGVGKDDTLTGPGDQAFVEALKKTGVKHTFVESARTPRVDRVAALSERRRPRLLFK